MSCRVLIAGGGLFAVRCTADEWGWGVACNIAMQEEQERLHWCEVDLEIQRELYPETEQAETEFVDPVFCVRKWGIYQ